jgi:hypothetical protein
MRDNEENSAKEIKRIEKLKADEAAQADKDEARRKIYMAKDNELEKAQKTADTRNAEKRASENSKDIAKEKARKDAYQAQENKIAEEQNARRLKEKKG